LVADYLFLLYFEDFCVGFDCVFASFNSLALGGTSFCFELVDLFAMRDDLLVDLLVS
jgi:hypothetical protein